MDITIIIPHRNSSKLLKRLLDSYYKKIPNNQTIIIDDRSNNDEKEHLKKLQNYYKFELYDNFGIGAGAARNTGIKYIKGKWVLFADADDFFTDSFSETINKYINTHYDIIFFNVTSYFSETLKRAHRDKHIKQLMSSCKESNNDNILRYSYTVPWGKMFNSIFLKENNFKFEEILAGNDMMFSIQTGIAANKISYDTTEIYCNTVAEGSITNTLNKNLFESRFQATLRVNNLLKRNNLHKFQISILYFIGKSYQFGFKYFLHVLYHCIKNKSNFLIGLNKIFNYKDVLLDRQNPTYSKKS